MRLFFRRKREAISCVYTIGSRRPPGRMSQSAMLSVWNLTAFGLDLAFERGGRRDDIRAGLRIVGFERRVTIAFTVDENELTILRQFYGGQDWESAL